MHCEKLQNFAAYAVNWATPIHCLDYNSLSHYDSGSHAVWTTQPSTKSLWQVAFCM